MVPLISSIFVISVKVVHASKHLILNTEFNLSDFLYSAEIEKIIKSKNIKVGDRIKIVKDKESYEGILLPRIELGDNSSIIIKLDNGYNISIRYEKDTKMHLVKKGKLGKLEEGKGSLKEDKNKPTVAILGCGGTISSRVEYITGAVFPTISPSYLISSFPELNDISNIRSKKLFSLLSEDMHPEHWKIIARETAKEIKSGVDGVVLMHGTDTMHYTSAALSFMLQNLPVPVVMVGAQRSSDRGSSDNLINMVCATLAAAKSDIAEVSVCMHGSSSDEFANLHQGTKVRKLHTSRRDAFQSVNALPFAKIWYEEEEIEYLRDDYRKRDKRKFELDDKLNSNVGLIQIHPGIKPEFIQSLSNFYEGIVITSTGLGNVPANPFNDKFAVSIIPSLKSLIDSGIPVIVAPQTIFGRVNMMVYTSGRMLHEIGAIGNGCDWLPEAALVKLMWVLGHAKNMNRIREMMLTNYAGEISERREVL